MEHIPFNRPSFLEKGITHVRRAFENHHISGDGEFSALCQGFFESEIGSAKALLTSSCTDALEMSALLLEIKPGDEVIVPSYTFVSSANAFVLRNGHPVFVDIRPDTLNVDESLLEAAITSRTRAIVVVHYAGIACEMDEICTIARRHGLAVVEDNAHGLFGRYKGKPLGSFGDLATLSFHETKNLSCGEGGALLLNNKSLVERAEILREKGTDRTRFFRGEVAKYCWQDIGSSFLPSDVLAALLWAQIEVHMEIQERRRQIYYRYASGLENWSRRNGITLPIIPSHCSSSYHMFYLLFPGHDSQAAFIAHMKAENINTVFHYQPLHLTPMGLRFGGREGQCPVSESISERIVRFPFFKDLTSVQLDRVIESAEEFAR